MSRLSKENCPHQCQWASSNLLRIWIEQKSGVRVNLLFAWTGMSIFLLLDISTPGSQDFLRQDLTPSPPRFSGLRVQPGLYHQRSWLPSLQRADHETCQPPWLREPIPTINLSLCPTGSLENLPNTGRFGFCTLGKFFFPYYPLNIFLCSFWCVLCSRTLVICILLSAARPPYLLSYLLSF